MIGTVVVVAGGLACIVIVFIEVHRTVVRDKGQYAAGAGVGRLPAPAQVLPYWLFLGLPAGVALAVGLWSINTPLSLDAVMRDGWETAILDDEANRATELSAVSSTGSLLVAAGRLGEDSTFWISEDATVWDEVGSFPELYPGAQVIALTTAEGFGLVAVGEAGDAPAIWTSSSQHPDDLNLLQLPAEFSGATLTDIVTSETEITVGGTVGGKPVFWSRRIDSLWSRTIPDPAVFSGATLKDLGFSPKFGFVALGETNGHDGLWLSDDLSKWNLVTLPEAEFANADINGLVATELGLTVFGSVFGEPAWWTSVDGISWTKVVFEQDFFSDADLLAASSLDGYGLVAVGSEEGAPKLWLNPYAP